MTDVVVVGAGVIGCAVASKLARKGLSVVVLEAGPRIAEGTTSRNSGVIHAGIYYPPGSLKADLCIRGAKLLYEWCGARGVPHLKTGKLIVATSDAQLEGLDSIYQNAVKSGAQGLERIAGARARELEPGVPSVAAILSRDTGIVDPYEFSLSLIRDAEEHGAMLLTQALVERIEKLPGSGGGYRVHSSRGEVDARIVINAAGLHTDEIAGMVGISKYKIHPWRGDYFTFRSKTRFKHLVYPVKEKGAAGLGVHLTIDLQGRYKLGPDVEAIRSKTDFAPPTGEALARKLEAFRASAAKLFGAVSAEDLSYDTCGIRPKLRAPEEKEEKDFVIAQDLPGFINLVGIESPGLTSSLAVAERVEGLI